MSEKDNLWVCLRYSPSPMPFTSKSRKPSHTPSYGSGCENTKAPTRINTQGINILVSD